MTVDVLTAVFMTVEFLRDVLIRIYDLAAVLMTADRNSCFDENGLSNSCFDDS
jgi:hypothetical protein